jgi:hypothetical protein
VRADVDTGRCVLYSNYIRQQAVHALSRHTRHTTSISMCIYKAQCGTGLGSPEIDLSALAIGYWLISVCSLDWGSGIGVRGSLLVRPRGRQREAGGPSPRRYSLICGRLPALALGLTAFHLSIAAFWSKRFGPLIPCARHELLGVCSIRHERVHQTAVITRLSLILRFQRSHNRAAVKRDLVVLLLGCSMPMLAT